MAATIPARYALGRGTTFLIQYAGDYFYLCVSDGSMELSTDQIEINNNCYSGWKVKLPGNKSGTINVTGFVASSTVPGQAGDMLFKLFGNIIDFEFEAFDGQPNPQMAMRFSASGVVTNCRVSISPDDAIRAELTIDVSGAPQAWAALASS